MVNSTGLPSSLYGGAGNDTLQGGLAGDILNWGPGADVLQGMDGNDLLKARDLACNQTINCGGGSNKADLDLLPKGRPTNRTAGRPAGLVSLRRAEAPTGIEPV